jgi:hypothetical protein
MFKVILKKIPYIISLHYIIKKYLLYENFNLDQKIEIIAIYGMEWKTSSFDLNLSNLFTWEASQEKPLYWQNLHSLLCNRYKKGSYLIDIEKEYIKDQRIKDMLKLIH